MKTHSSRRKKYVFQPVNVGNIVEAGEDVKQGACPDQAGESDHCGDAAVMADRITEALKGSDMVLTTGGVSAGDFDHIPKVMEEIGARLLFHRLPFKPGGAMFVAVKDGKVILGLSGNPEAAAIGLLRVGLPYMKKLCGRTDIAFLEAEAVLAEAFPKPSKGARLLRGQAQILDGKLVFHLMDNQKNGAVSSMLDCNLLGEIPAGSAGISAGTKLRVF